MRRSANLSLVKHVSLLPEWFSLEKYNDAKYLDAARWYEQLLVRVFFLRYAFYEPVMMKVWAKPIVDLLDHDELKMFFYGGEIEELKNRSPFYSLGVRLATVRDIFSLERGMDENEKKHSRKFFDQMGREGWFLNRKRTKCPSWVNDPIDNFSDYGSLTIKINPYLPRSILEEQFSSLLKELQVRATPYNPKFSDWVRFAVLPYLDLKIWARENKTSITNRVLADAIFPQGEGGEEVVRKTTTKIAKQITSAKEMAALAAYAAGDVLRQKTEQEVTQPFPENKAS